MPRYRLHHSGVVSSAFGKGLALPALGRPPPWAGPGAFTVRLQEARPLPQRRSGTMSPYQHGEVLRDRTRRTRPTSNPSATTRALRAARPSRSEQHADGPHLNQDITPRSAAGNYIGGTVQVIPTSSRRTNGVSVTATTTTSTIVLVEIAARVATIEGLPFFEAIRQLSTRAAARADSLHPRHADASGSRPPES